MSEFFTDYPYVTWILIGFGVLAVLSKYLKFDPIDKLIDRVGKYKFEEVNHLDNPQLKELIELFRQQNWDEIQQRFNNFGDSYRSFGFRALGQYADDDILNTWLKTQPESEFPRLIKAYRLVFQGWLHRGRGTIDTVSEKNLALFKGCLKEAIDVLNSIDSSATYKVHKNALLLKIYRSMDTPRAEIHNCYKEVVIGNENHAELNFNYFSAISPKWGGSQEEVNTYLNSLEHKSEFINRLITVQYYFDYVFMMDGTDDDKNIKHFIDEMKSYVIPEDELYKFEFYLLLYWLSNNLEYKGLENHYKQLVLPYCKD